MEVAKHFSTPFWCDKLEFDIQTVANKCLAMRSSNYPHRIVSNRGGWQSKNLRLDTVAEFSELNQQLLEKLDVIAKSISTNTRIKFGLSNAWVNINNRHNSNARHTHVGSALSAVIYIQVDEHTGKIRFYDDHSPIKHYPFRMPSKRNHFRLEEEYTPYPGMLLVFPAWIPHSVEPSQSDLERISIAVNIKVHDAYD